MIPVVDDLLAAPIGVALLDRLEESQRTTFLPFTALGDSDPSAVQRSIRTVETVPIGQFLHSVLDAASSLAGPWTQGAAESLSLAYQNRAGRRPLAEAVWQRFANQLLEPFDPSSQELWIDLAQPPADLHPGFSDFSRVYGQGQFTWSGL
jgi:hypothetical protein